MWCFWKQFLSFTKHNGMLQDKHVLTLCAASFQICLWVYPCVHQCFAHYHSIPRKISNLGGLSLASSWKPCQFYRPFCYLQKVDFKGSHKNSFESLCSEYCHYRSDWLLSNIQKSWVTYRGKFIPRNAFSSSLVTVKFLPFWWA